MHNPRYNIFTYPSIDISFKSPPKYLAYFIHDKYLEFILTNTLTNLEIGRPYPNPAIGALNSVWLNSGSST